MHLTDAVSAPWMEFRRRREGLQYALDGGLWLHRFRLRGEPMAHLVSSDRALLLLAGKRLGLRPEWLQYKPLKLPLTGQRLAAWHWDLRAGYLERAVTLASPQR
jgi:hypothetical protein